MNKLKIIVLFLILTMNSFAQLYFGVTGGPTIPNFEESGMYKPTFNICGNIYYRTPINLMLCGQISYINNMKLSESWAINNMGGSSIEDNTAYITYNPILSLSLEYSTMSQNELTLFYFGIGGGIFTSSANGVVKVASNYGYQKLVFYGEKHTNLGVSPKIGLMDEMANDLYISFELKYDLIFAVFREHLININIGIVLKIEQNE